MPFLPSFLVPGCLNCRLSLSLFFARESRLIWRTWGTIRFNLDRPIRGSRLFIGRKAIIILTRSVLYSDSPIGQQILKQRIV